MNLKKLIIYDDDNLFNILNEIKEHLNFEPIKIDKKKLDYEINRFNGDYLIFSKEKKEKYKNQITIEETPLKIDKLIEIINLNFLKSRFVSQSHVDIGKYKLDINSRVISNNENKLNLTERETNLIIYLNDSPVPVKINKLQKDVWTYGAKLETHTVETHIYRLRKKIKDKFKDEAFIKSSKEGYSIN